MEVYPKNSFDRFGDDLTELILQYLTFEDKVRLECVSKQWRRLVFNKQFVIEINGITDNVFNDNELHNSLNKLFRRINSRIQLNEQSLKSVLKKCPNIRKVNLKIDIDWSLLSLIGRYCPRIKSLTFGTLTCDVRSVDFFLKYGHKLEEIVIYKLNDEIKEFLKLCPNLKKVNARLMSYHNALTYFAKEDKLFLPKLECFENYTNSGYDLNISSNYMIEFETFTNRYNQTIKTLNISFGYLTEKELKTCLQYISRFENLRQLKFIIDLQQRAERIDDCLSLIGQKCNKLLKLHLSINNSFSISDRFFDIFTNFKTIKKLKITLKINKALKGSVECFKHCKQLKYLDINYSELKEHFFTNIESFVPKLQSLKISTDKQYSDSFIDSFQSMKSIRRVELVIDGSNNDRYMTWCFGKCLNEIMSSHNGKESIRINDNCGLINYFYVYEDFDRY